MNLTQLNDAFTHFANWVKAGLNKKADATATTNALNSKADSSAVNTALLAKADTSTVNTALAGKQNTVLVGTADPGAGVGVNGDVFLVTDP